MPQLHDSASWPMKHAFALLSLCWLASLAVAAGDAVLPGDHPLTASQAGDLLISELRCAACHAGLERRSLAEKTAPDLAEAGARISPGYLRRFLESPSSVHSGTTMPDLLASRPAAQRGRIAEALTHFLVAQAKAPFTANRPAPADREQGQTLYHSVGCVACHGPREVLADAPPKRNEELDEEEDPRLKVKRAIQPIAVPLGHVAAKYSVKSLGEFLFQPLLVRSSGRMPDMKLTSAESLAIAGYLVGEKAQAKQQHAEKTQAEHELPQAEPALVPQDALVKEGRDYFRQLNCAGCHSLAGFKAAPLVGSLTTADLSRGCLSKTGDRSPRFNLDDAQLQAIIAALHDKSPADVDRLVVAKMLTAFRCIACHVRDDYGGVPEAYSGYFLGSEQKLGEDGRIPPPLTLIGAKLQPEWLKKVLFDGESVRPYMATRMPQYGAANLEQLPVVFARLDVLHGQTLNIPSAENRSESERNREKLLRAGGRDLLGDTGLNCVACHTFNGKAAPGSQGIDLVTTTQRLQGVWFNRYLRNPGAFRPRTVMPSAWPDGIAMHKTILDGNTDVQIAAVWYYLSLGTSAADPSGIRRVNTRLTVAERAQTYRGRSKVAGFRGIAVGLPEKLSYAFNAETGTLAAIWQGEFINVNWSGQGSGDFSPASDPITLAQDVSFAQLADETSPWPLLPIMTKEAKTNPNPLYPKYLGYQFRGYDLGESSIPTFRYRSGTVEFEDRSVAAGFPDRPHLQRTLRVQSPTRQSIWFRALTGDIRQESDQVFRSDRLRLTIPPCETKRRSLPAYPQRSELLLHLQIPPGQSALEFQYEPLGK